MYPTDYYVVRNKLFNDIEISELDLIDLYYDKRITGVEASAREYLLRALYKPETLKIENIVPVDTVTVGESLDEQIRWQIDNSLFYEDLCEYRHSLSADAAGEPFIYIYNIDFSAENRDRDIVKYNKYFRVEAASGHLTSQLVDSPDDINGSCTMEYNRLHNKHFNDVARWDLPH